MNSFTATQKITDNRVATVALALTLAIPLIFLGVELSQTKHPNQDEIWGLAAGLLAMGGAVFLVLRSKTVLVLKPSGINFTYTMLFKRQIKIEKNQIADWEIVHHSFFQGMGMHRNFRGRWSYVLTPGPALAITTTKGKRYRFGLNGSTKAKRFIAEHWEQNDMNYG